MRFLPLLRLRLFLSFFLLASGCAVMPGIETSAPVSEDALLVLKTGSVFIQAGSTTSFPITRAGSSKALSFTLTNMGIKTLELTGNSNLVILSGLDQALFTISTVPALTSLSYNQSAEFSVTFAPDTSGIKTVTLTIPNNSSDNPAYTFNIQAEASGTVATPTFDTITPGAYATSQTITLASATSGAAIHYTLNGTTPDCSSTLYNPAAPIILSSSSTVQAVACRPAWDTSEILSGFFEIGETVAAPSFNSITPGTYQTPQSVTLLTPTSGATIHFTTDGNDPTCGSTLYSAPLELPLESSTTIKAIACKTGWSPSPISSGTYTITGTVATPVFSSSLPGIHTPPVTVTLSSSTALATIHYTMDGATPNCDSPLYNPAAPPVFSSSTTIKAIACKADWAPSALLSGFFEIENTVATPEFDTITPGLYQSTQTVTLSTQTAGATIHYTLGGSTPTCASTLYNSTDKIPLGTNSVTTIKALACKSGFTNSGVLSGTFTLTGTVATPTFSSVTPGDYTQSQNISLATSTPGASIHYTLDGSAPDCDSALYSSALNVPLFTTRTIRAMACKADWLPSATLSGSFTVTGPTATPTFDGNQPGTYPSDTSISVILAVTTPDATIHYTDDNTEPSCSSALYSAPLTVMVGESITFKAVACKTDWAPSTVLTGTFTVSIPEIPLITGLSATDGTFTDKVTLTWDDAGTDVDSYVLYRDTDPAGSFADVLTTVSSTSYDDTTASPMTTYYYKIKGKKGTFLGEANTPESGFAKSTVITVTDNWDNAHGFDFSSPIGIAVSSDKILVADSGYHRIQVFDPTGLHLFNIGKNSGDKSSGTGNGELNSPSGVAVYNSEIYVADRLNNRIQVFDMSGNYLRQWGSLGSGNTQFLQPASVAVANDEVFVADTGNSSIKVFSLAGVFQRKWSGVTSPASITLSGDYVYVCDLQVQSLHRFSPTGTNQISFASIGAADGQVNSPKALYFFKEHLYVAEAGNHRVQAFDANQAFVQKWGSEGTAAGQFKSPQGLALGTEGQMTLLYVADTGNNRIQKIRFQ